MSELMLSFHPLESFDDRMTELRTEFRNEWERHWGLRSDGSPRDRSLNDETEIRRLNETADRLVRAAENLSPARLPDGKRTMPGWLKRDAELERGSLQEHIATLRSQLPQEPFSDPNFWSRLRSTLRESASPAQQRELFFRTAVEFKVFEKFGATPADMAARALELLGFLVATRSVGAGQYLTRVSRCYILGLHAELAIMCRAVLEAALEDREIDEAVVARILQAQGLRRANLDVLIEAAKQVGILDSVGYRAAVAIRKAGNDAVHSVPASPNPLSLLAELKAALEQVGAEE